MAETPATYLIVPYAQTEGEARVLLTQIQLSRAKSDSPNLIPDNAGQWALAGGEAGAGQSVTTAAFQLFLDTTGLNLADPQVMARYGLSSPQIKKLKDADYQPLNVCYLETNADGLDRLADDVNSNLNNQSRLVNRVYATAQVARLSQALQEIGPIPPPEKGWRRYILDTYYSGQAAPPALDMVFPTLVTQIAERSRMSGEVYTLALQNLPGGGSVPVGPRLVRLDVEGAQGIPGQTNAYATNYDPSGSVTIRAVIEPQGSSGAIDWQGGALDPSGRADYRSVPLNQITRFGQPLSVTATLGSSKQSITLIIRPLLKSFTIANAQPSDDPSEDKVFIAEYSDDEAPIKINIAMTPDSSEAYEHLQWTGTGGSPDPDGSKNVYIVPRNKLTDSTDPVRVRVAVNPWWDFILYILPRLRQLTLVPANYVYNTGGNNYQVDFHAANNYVIVATTWPNIALAHQALSWTVPGGVVAPAGAAQINVPRSPIDNVGANQAYTVEVRRNGVVLRSLTVNVTVQPVITGLAFSDYVFSTVGGGWHSYAAAGQFGLPANLATRVTVTTSPNNAAAWAHVQWQNTNGAVPPPPPPAVPPANLAAQQLINLNAVPLVNPLQVGARVGQAPIQQLLLDIRAPQAWPGNGLQLQVNQITFAGGRAVVRDDPGNVGVAFNRNWVRGTGHALQSPQTYTRNTAVSQAAVIGLAAPPNANTIVDVRATAFIPLADGTLVPIEWQWNGTNINILPAPPATFNVANQAGNVNLPNEVVYADPLFISWEMRIGGMAPGNWILFDVTSHMFYVTLGDPAAYRLSGAVLAAAARPYFTLLAISCQAASGLNNIAAVVPAIFGAFSALNPATGVNANFQQRKRVVGSDFTYWVPGRWAIDEWPGQNLPHMFDNPRGNAAAHPDGSGSCKAWAEMFICMGALHGIGGLNIVEIEPSPLVSGVAPNADLFLVNNWVFTTPPAISAIAYTHTYRPGLAAAAGRATLGNNGLVGQNSQQPPPSFQNHFIVRDTNPVVNTLYDPSYGSGPHATWRAWVAAAIGGLYRGGIPAPNAGFITPAALALTVLNTPVKLTDRITGALLN